MSAATPAPGRRLSIHPHITGDRMKEETAVVRTRSAPIAQELALEHAALVRRLARLQRRVTEQLQAGARCQAVLEADNLRLRAEVVLLRTAMVWGLRTSALGTGPATRRRHAPATPDPALQGARDMICRTGCVGHAHPWLDEDGQCRQRGQPCDRLD